MIQQLALPPIETMNLKTAVHELPDNHARYLGNVLLNQPGLLKRRGAVRMTSELVSGINNTDDVVAIVSTTDPVGNLRIATLGKTGTFCPGQYLSSPSNVTITGLFPNTGGLIVDAKPAIGGGVWIGVMTAYEGGAQALALWRGGWGALYSTGTAAVSAGSTTVTGTGTSWLTNGTPVRPGDFLIDAHSVCIGVVKAVNSNTSITLESGAPIALSGSYTLTPLRAFQQVITKGRITINSSSSAVTGADTKFSLLSSNWVLVRKSDFAQIGAVSSVQTDTGLTLAANSGVTGQNIEYLALNTIGHTSTDYKDQMVSAFPGSFNATYAQRQWFAMGHNAYFSDIQNGEAIDFSAADGDYIPVSSSIGYNSAIRGLFPTPGGLVVFKDKETFAIVGSTPETFAVERLADDGLLQGGSAYAGYRGGVIWAGFQGIWYWPGSGQPVNLTEDLLGPVYRTLVQTLSGASPQLVTLSAVQDHLFCSFVGYQFPFSLRKGASTTAVVDPTLVMYLPSGALSIWSNFPHRSSVTFNKTGDVQTSWYVAHGSGNNVAGNFNDLLDDTTGEDTLQLASQPLPKNDFYVESKRYNVGPGLRVMVWRRLLLRYLLTAATNVLRLDTMTGLSETGAQQTTTMPAVTDESDGKWVFDYRSPYFGFRLYQNDNTTISKLEVEGTFEIGYKAQRAGRP